MDRFNQNYQQYPQYLGNNPRRRMSRLVDEEDYFIDDPVLRGNPHMGSFRQERYRRTDRHVLQDFGNPLGPDGFSANSNPVYSVGMGGGDADFVGRNTTVGRPSIYPHPLSVPSPENSRFAEPPFVTQQFGRNLSPVERFPQGQQ